MKTEARVEPTILATRGAVEALTSVDGNVAAPRWKRVDAKRTGSSSRNAKGAEPLWVMAFERSPAGFDGSLFALADELGRQCLMSHVTMQVKGRGLSTFVVMGPIDEQAQIDLLRSIPRSVRVLHLGADRNETKAISLALRNEVEPTSIVRAHWDGQELRVLNAALDELTVPRDRLLEVKHLNAKSLNDFEIDLGDLHFKKPDVHLDWEALGELVDPDAALRAKQQSDVFNRRYGAAIRALREQHKLRQSSVSGLSERQISRIEKGEQRATSKALAKLARAHDMPLNEYLAASAGVLESST